PLSSSSSPFSKKVVPPLESFNNSEDYGKVFQIFTEKFLYDDSALDAFDRIYRESHSEDSFVDGMLTADPEFHV
ncbi:hypothetical protein H0H93_001948, partial [Arthromyces matolae]